MIGPLRILMLLSCFSLLPLLPGGAVPFGSGTNELLHQKPDHHDHPAPEGTLLYPSILYPGENVLTFSNPDGIESIRPMFNEAMHEYYTIETLKESYHCADSVQVRVTIHAASVVIGARFVVTDCNKRRKLFPMRNFTWLIDTVEYDDMYVGETQCQRFRIGVGKQLGEDGEFIDSITCAVPGVSFQFSEMKEPPILLPPDREFRYYTVCFCPESPGEYRFPVLVWTRRPEPSGGHGSTPVGDTAHVVVLPREGEVPPSTGGEL